MKRLLCLAFIVGAALAAPLTAADSWVGIYGVQDTSGGAEGARCLAVTPGGYALGGPTTTYSGNNQANFWLVETDGTGHAQSQRSYYTGTEIFTNMNSLLYLDGGGFLMAGNTGSSPDALIVKVNASGVVQWSKRYGNIGGSYAVNRIIPTTDGGFAFTGQWGSSLALVKLDSGGGVTFAKRYKGTGTSDFNAGVDLVEVADGFVVLGGQINASQTEIRLLKTDADGDFAWEKLYGGASDETPGGLARSGDGGYVFTGVTHSFGGTQAWVVRVDSTGTIVWQKAYVDTYSATHGCGGNRVIPTADGGFLVAGVVGTTSGGLYKLASDGTLQWEKTLAKGNGYSFFTDVIQKADGSFVASGFANGGFFSPNADMLLQVGPAGEFVGCLEYEVTKTAQITTTDTVSTATVATETADTPVGPTVIDAMVVEHDTDAPVSVCTSVLPAFLIPGTLASDAHGNGQTVSNVNGVGDPTERVLVEPTWTNTGGSPLVLTSTTPVVQDSALDFEFDLTADYGTVGAGASADCFLATGDCLVAGVPANDQRPTQHWDTHFDETLNGSWAYRWEVHIGGSFADEPLTDQFYKYVETLFHNGVTGGCGGGNYCPTSPVTRAQMAVFLLKGQHGGTYAPPVCSSTVFGDVPCPGGTFVDWVNQLAADNITGGCGGGNYCPANPVTRAQMAVFLLKAEHGGAYTPPACAATVFTDVVCPGAQFVDWINQLSAEGITGGCGGGNYCPGNSVTRGQMAVFLTRTFGLQLNAILLP